MEPAARNVKAEDDKDDSPEGRPKFLSILGVPLPELRLQMQNGSRCQYKKIVVCRTPILQLMGRNIKMN